MSKLKITNISISNATSKSSPQKIHYLTLLFSLALLSLFIVSSLFRKLNFDESLALKSGWLLFNQVESELPFYMPFTYFLGILSTGITDPFWVFFTSRLFVIATVSLSIYWSFKTVLRTNKEWLIFFLVLLSHYIFTTHAIEFRYDYGILVGLILSFGCLVRNNNLTCFLLGNILLFIAFHHLKGLFFFTLISIFSFFWFIYKTERLTYFFYTSLGGIFFSSIWLFLSYLNGHLMEIIKVYDFFLGLGQSSERQNVFRALSKAVIQDFFWWLLAIMFLPVYFFTKSKDNNSNEKWLLGYFSLLPIIFILLHPHPWPYMITLAIPFITIIISKQLLITCEQINKNKILVIFISGYCLQFFMSGTPIWGNFIKSLLSNHNQQIQTLKLLKSHVHLGDKIIDPSGLAYFIPPCYKEWYSDTLFYRKILDKKWRKNSLTKPNSNCNWMLNTYRLKHLGDKEYLERIVEFDYWQCALYSKHQFNITQEAQYCNHRNLENYW